VAQVVQAGAVQVQQVEMAHQVQITSVAAVVVLPVAQSQRIAVASAVKA
jgi:hypothetical protein